MNRDVAVEELAGRNLSISISLLMVLLGVIIMLLPLWWPWDGIIRNHVMWDTSYWIGFLLLMTGISVLLGRIIRIQAVGAGNMKVMGFELPVEIGGAMFVLFFLLLGGSAVTFAAKLHDSEPRFAKVEESRKKQDLKIENDAVKFVVEHDTYISQTRQLADVQKKLKKSENDLAEMTGKYNGAAAILEAHVLDQEGADLMRLAIECKDGLGTQWISWPKRLTGHDDVKADLSATSKEGVLPSEVEPFRVYKLATTFHLNRADDDSDDGRIISFKVAQDDRKLTYRITPTGRPLKEFCDSLASARRDSSDGQTLNAAPHQGKSTTASEAMIAAGR